MQIIEVTTKKDWRLFHQVAYHIYRDNDKWIAYLENDIEDVFTPAKNKAYEHGEAICYVLLDNQQQAVGRIAAFIDHERNKELPYPVGGIGFFECINNQEYAFALFEKAAGYLQKKGLQAIDGPINFGERDKFWGLLVKGYDEVPLYQENYHPKYYRDFFEAWGFRPFEQVLTLFVDIHDIPIPRFLKLAERLQRNNPYSVRPPDMSNLRKAAEDFVEIYNGSFAEFDHFKPLEFEPVYKTFKAMKPVVDARAVAYVYHEERPIAFCVFIPELNPFLKHAKGKMNWWNILRFILKLKLTKKKELKGIAFGIIPEFQKKGILSLIVEYLWQIYEPNILARYRFLHLAGIRAHNELMVKSTGNLVTTPKRIHQTYRKLLDENLAFEPFDMPHEIEG